MKRRGDFITYIFLMLSTHLLQADVQVSFDEYLAETAKQCVHACINEKIETKKLADTAACMQKCPAIKDVSIARPISDDIEVTVVSSKPHARVNEIYVLNSDGQILDASLYENIDRLPLVQTKNSDSHLSPICKKFLLAIPHELLREYDVEWENGASITLYDKKQPFFTVTCSASTPPSALIHEACKKIKDELKARGELGEEPLVVWDADIRFDKQIILSRK